MSSIEIKPGYITLPLPVQPLSVEKTEPHESEIVEITADDILDSSDEEIIPHIKNAPFVKRASIFESENLDKTNDTRDGNVSKCTSQEEVEVQGLNEDFYSLNNLRVHEQLVLNCVSDLDDISMSEKPEHSEQIDFATCFKTVETVLCEKDKPVYRCDKCEFKTYHRNALKRHKLIHLKPDETQYFYCYHCCYEFKRKDTLRRHILRHFKNKEVPFHCYSCNFMTLKRVLIIKHIKKHSKCVKRYRCDKCHYKTNMHRNLKRHKIIHLKPEEIQYFCCYHCSYKSTRIYTLRRHIFQHFKNKEVIFHCYICDFMTVNRDLIIEHIKKHAQFKLHKLSHKTQTEKYRCDKCNYNTFRRQHFNRHKITHLKPEEIQYFYCYHCSHKSKQKYDLKVHISRHFSNENVPFHCYICDFMTLKRNLIVEHFKKHAHVKLHKLSYKIQKEKYCCDKCNYNTFKRHNFNRHKLAHLKPEEIQDFYCYHCSHKFTRKDTLRRHIFQHFKNKEVTQTEKYRCNKCNYNTFRRQHFNRHKITHLKPEEIQYFYCYHCSHKYKHKYDLKVHISTHFTNENVPFHCYICDFMTLKRDLIIEHIKKHARVKLHKLSYKIQTEKYRCDKCNYNTFRRQHFNRHKITHLKPEEIQYFYCYHCSHKSKQKYDLKVHISRHFNNENVPFHCYICDFMTLKRDLIIEHIKNHTKLKLRKRSRKTETEKYNCDKCDYNTFRRDLLDRHKLIHLKPEDIQYFYCYHCSYKSKRKDHLKTHIFNHLKNEEVTFPCYICDFTTVKKDLITKHIKKHSKLQIATENMF